MKSVGLHNHSTLLTMLQPITSTTQTRVVTRHHYVLFQHQSSFRGKSSGGVANVCCFLTLSRQKGKGKNSHRKYKTVRSLVRFIHRENSRRSELYKILLLTKENSKWQISLGSSGKINDPVFSYYFPDEPQISAMVSENIRNRENLN